MYDTHKPRNAVPLVSLQSPVSALRLDNGLNSAGECGALLPTLSFTQKITFPSAPKETPTVQFYQHHQ